MVVIPITGAGLGLLLFMLPGIGGFLFKCLLAYVMIVVAIYSVCKLYRFNKELNKELGR